MKIILNDIPQDDWILAIRAAKWIIGRTDRKDAVLTYGEGRFMRDMYVKRNKASITVRLCQWSNP